MTEYGDSLKIYWLQTLKGFAVGLLLAIVITWLTKTDYTNVILFTIICGPACSIVFYGLYYGMGVSAGVGEGIFNTISFYLILFLGQVLFRL